MSVSDKHTMYSYMLSEWQKAGHFASFEKAVKDEGVTYLPLLGGQSDEEYEAYKQRGSVAMFFKKTIVTYRGMVMRKPPQVGDDEPVAEYLKNVTGSGDSFRDYMYSVVGRYFTAGRCGTLIDLPEGLTNAEPLFLFYSAESIINWREDTINGITQLVEVRLEEEIEVQLDEFTWETAKQYRVLDLDEGKYRVRVFNDQEIMVGDEVYPLMNNSTMDHIPFVIHGGVDVQPPFLTEILDLNLHHYQVTTDEAHGIHWAALPTPYVTGLDTPPDKIGPTAMIALPDPQSTAGFMEFSGSGLQPSAAKLKVYEDQISSLAINMVMNNELAVKTATQTSVDSSSQTASLSGTVTMLSAEFTKLLTIAADWMGKTVGPVTINQDFISSKMSPDMINAVRQSWLDGAISYESMWLQLQQGEIAPEAKTAEEEQGDIDIAEPAGMAGAE